MTGRRFQCAGCGFTLTANNTEAERDAEVAALYKRLDDDELVSTCDACHAQILANLKERHGHDGPY